MALSNPYYIEPNTETGYNPNLTGDASFAPIKNGDFSDNMNSGGSSFGGAVADGFSGGGGNYAAGAAGLASITGDAISAAHQKLNLPMYGGLQYSNGRPSYDGTQWQDARSLKPISNKLTGQNASNILNSTTKGFTSGMSAGGWIGGVALGSYGTFSQSAGPVSVNHHRQQLQKDSALQQARAYQANYNEANSAADQNFNAQSDYQRRISNNRRLQSLYSLPQGY